MTGAVKRRADLLNREEAAIYTGVSDSWLARHAYDGLGPPLIRLGGRIYYRRDSLDDWIDAQEQSCPVVSKSATSAPSPSSAARKRAPSTTTSVTAATGTSSPPEVDLAKRLRISHSKHTEPPAPQLVGLDGGKATTSPS